MKFLTLISSAILLTCTSLTAASPLAKRDFGPVTIFTPPSTYTHERTLYGRELMLKTQASDKGTLLATWENYTPTKPYFPIYRSTDHGFTWKEISRVQDTVNGWGMRYQPVLYELEQDLAGFKTGTILVAGNSIPQDLSKTQLDLYASTDRGLTWTFVSHIANGGVALPNNGETPVWEPFLMVYNNQLVCYYSDQRDSKYGQKIVHQVTSDGKSWGPVVNDVTYPVYTARPGMPIVRRLGTGNYMMTYEYGGGPEYKDYQFPVHYKISNNPLNFGNVGDTALRTTSGYVPKGSPTHIWTSVGGVNGTIVATAASDSDLYINRANGQGPWTVLKTNAPAAYTRYLDVGLNPKDIAIIAGGQLGQGPTNKVTFTATDVNGCTTCS